MAVIIMEWAKLSMNPKSEQHAAGLDQLSPGNKGRLIAERAYCSA